MTFDEQLQRAFDTLTGRLRDDITRHTSTIAADLAAAAEIDREQAAADARGAADLEAAEARTAAAREADARISAAARDGEARMAAAARDADARLRAAVTAAETAARESGREGGYASGLLEGRQSGSVEGRQAGILEGRQAGVLEGRRQAEQETDERIDAALAAARVEWRAAQRAASERLVHAVRSLERARSLSDILDTLGRCAGGEASRVAVVLLARGERFRGWRFIGFGASFDEPGALEFGAPEAGVIHEAAHTGRSVFGGPSDAPAFAELPADAECVAVPITLGGQVVAVLYGDDGSTPASHDPFGVWPQTLEVLARHAAGYLETQTALKAAGLWSDRPVPAAPPVRQVPADDAGGDDELAARRYARLLVSEIKLYHEADVVAGRRDRDLAKRLGGEIARARLLYDQRVAQHIRQSADYFHAELIQTLANGDETLLAVGT
jgi:hypothetical protein